MIKASPPQRWYSRTRKKGVDHNQFCFCEMVSTSGLRYFDTLGPTSTIVRRLPNDKSNIEHVHPVHKSDYLSLLEETSALD